MIENLRVDASGAGFAEALVTKDGAQVSGENLVVVNASTVSTVFRDGFESGDTAEWSQSVP